MSVDHINSFSRIKENVGDYFSCGVTLVLKPTFNVLVRIPHEDFKKDPRYWTHVSFHLD
jgi:hypothetical protein